MSASPGANFQIEEFEQQIERRLRIQISFIDLEPISAVLDGDSGVVRAKRCTRTENRSPVISPQSNGWRVKRNKGLGHDGTRCCDGYRRIPQFGNACWRIVTPSALNFGVGKIQNLPFLESPQILQSKIGHNCVSEVEHLEVEQPR